MRCKNIGATVLVCIVGLSLLQGHVYAYGLINNRTYLWPEGQVLGAKKYEGFIYVVKGKSKIVPSSKPTVTPTRKPTITPIPTILTPTSYGQPVNTPTITPRAAPGPRNNSSSTYPTHLPTSPPTINLCGNITCYPRQVCSHRICREQCGPDGDCIGSYHCVSGACIPNATSNSSSSVSQAPTATPPITQHSSSSSTQPTQAPSSSSSLSINPTQQPEPSPTNIIYPTRVPVNNAIFNRTGGQENSPTIPTPTAIPEILRGKTSTIVIEAPEPTKSPYHVASLPAPTPIILKGEDMKTIKIDLPKTEAVTPDDTKASTPKDLDITIERKVGSGIAVTQQEFVIQKGVQTITISANDQSQGKNLVIEKNDTKARVTMPLSINPTTNILTVDTPQGPMKVSIMPDDALAIIRQLKVVDQNSATDDISLEMHNLQLEYKIRANKMEKLLWIIPISIPKDVYVAADSGGLTEIKKTPLYDFLSLFTF